MKFDRILKSPNVTPSRTSLPGQVGDNMTRSSERPPITTILIIS